MKKRILLTDDEPNIVLVVTKRLEIQGYEVLIARDGEEALKKARELKPDLVLLDIMLPGVDGLNVCRILKADEATRNIPVVLFSARAQTWDKEAGREFGANAYVEKPFQPEELLATIEKLLKSSP